jgi:hypothetical protein
MLNSSGAVYQHAPLDRHDSIRLLELLPDVFGKPLRCIIHQYPRGYVVPYEALSYTWGDPVFPEQIYVGVDPASPSMPITQNLYNALQHLRKSDESRILWIDALCINQSNVEEKGHQVAHMGQVFSNAEVVTVWLGYSPSKRVLEILKSMEMIGQQADLHVREGKEFSYGKTDMYQLLQRLRAARLFESKWYVGHLCIGRTVD